jgi:hypothetical protein
MRRGKCVQGTARKRPAPFKRHIPFEKPLTILFKYAVPDICHTWANSVPTIGFSFHIEEAKV